MALQHMPGDPASVKELDDRLTILEGKILNNEIKMLDITAPNIVEIELSDDKAVLWINVDGVCALRVCRMTEVKVRRNGFALWDKKYGK